MRQPTQTFAGISEGDTIKAVVSDPTFAVTGAVRSVDILPNQAVVAEGDFFRLTLRARDEVPTLFVGSDKHGNIKELEVL